MKCVPCAHRICTFSTYVPGHFLLASLRDVIPVHGSFARDDDRSWASALVRESRALVWESLEALPCAAPRVSVCCSGSTLLLTTYVGLKCGNFARSIQYNTPGCVFLDVSFFFFFTTRDFFCCPPHRNPSPPDGPRHRRESRRPLREAHGLSEAARRGQVDERRGGWKEGRRKVEEDPEPREPGEGNA